MVNVLGSVLTPLYGNGPQVTPPGGIVFKLNFVFLTGTRALLRFLQLLASRRLTFQRLGSQTLLLEARQRIRGWGGRRGGWPSGAGLTGASREGGWLTGGATPASAETGSDGVTTGSSATGPTPGAGTAASVAGGADGVAANTASAAARGAGDSSIISSFFFLMRMRFLSGLGGSSCGAATSLVEREPFRPSCPPEPASPVRAFAPNFSSARRTASSSKALLWDATGIPSRFSSGISSRFSTPSCFANS